MRKILFALPLCAALLVGCSQPEEKADASVKPTKGAPTADGAQPAIQNNELTTNPNGKFVEPGSALGKK